MSTFSNLSLIDNQSAWLIVFTMMMALLLSSIIVFTYEKTSRDVTTPDHFMQSVILMAIVTATIMQSIGDSLARGFGIFGALAMLRFRINISSPRSVAFVFAAMGMGIACGVYSFVNAAIGTLAFCLTAFLLRLTPFSQQQNLLGELRFDAAQETDHREVVEGLLEKYCRAASLRRYRVYVDGEKANQIGYEYQVRLREQTQGPALAQALHALEGVHGVRLIFNDANEITYN